MSSEKRKVNVTSSGATSEAGVGAVEAVGENVSFKKKLLPRCKRAEGGFEYPRK